ncbi:unnamed protein product [Prunus brigantina]
MVVPFSLSSPSLGSKYSPPSTPLMKTSESTRHPLYPNLPPKDPPTSPCRTQESSAVFNSLLAMIQSPTSPCATSLKVSSMRGNQTSMCAQPAPPPPPPRNPYQRQINIISTINGGPTLAGTSNDSIKHYVRSSYAHQVFSTEQGPEDPRDEFVTQQAKPVEDLEHVCLHDDLPDRQVQIGTTLSPDLLSALIAFLRLNSEKRRAYDPERYEAMKTEVEKLSNIGFIMEVDYPTWLANVVMVRKPKKGWRMCVNYTNLNRACPKHSFPLPRID